ncbi:transposase, partial [Burkholderia cenocepacia]|uniref:transposase n=1 Tax=Burkholderia cenocepacia TaxID=95486 RepID=UPI0021191B2B
MERPEKVDYTNERCSLPPDECSALQARVRRAEQEVGRLHNRLELKTRELTNLTRAIVNSSVSHCDVETRLQRELQAMCTRMGDTAMPMIGLPAQADLPGKLVTVELPYGNTDQFGLAVIADEAKGVVERSSRNGPTTMQRQIGFAEAESAGKKRVTKRQRFLAEMEKVVPWSRLLSVIGPYYPKGERGRPPIGLERMLRIYLLQQWYGLSDEGLEDALYDSIAMRAFAGIDLAR